MSESKQQPSTQALLDGTYNAKYRPAHPPSLYGTLLRARMPLVDKVVPNPKRKQRAIEAYYKASRTKAIIWYNYVHLRAAFRRLVVGVIRMLRKLL